MIAMAKPPRPSMADALAAIASTSGENVATLQRGNVKRDNEAPEDVATQNGIGGNVPRHDVVTSRTTTTADGFKVRQRIERPHASIYAHPKVFKAIREIAAAEGRKPHDIYMDGLRLVLRNYGRDLDALNRGE